MTSGVHIVAVGARTPVGFSAESSAAAVRARISGVTEHPVLIDGAGQPLRSARDYQLAPTLMGPARLVELALAALTEVAAKMSVDSDRSTTLHVLLALPDPRPGFATKEVDALVQQIGAAKMPGISHIEVEAVVGGHAAALKALQQAANQIEQTPSCICVVGGVDTYFDVDTLNWLETNCCLARKGIRGGFVPGEGAGMLAVMSGAERGRRRLPSLARVRAIAMGWEPRSPDSDEGLLGEGLSDVVRRATRHLRVPEECVDEIYCDINGQRHRSDEWGFTALRLPLVFRDPTNYNTGAASWGDIGAASGVLACMLAIQAWQRRYALGTRALVWTSSTRGLRGAAVLECEEA